VVPGHAATPWNCLQKVRRVRGDRTPALELFLFLAGQIALHYSFESENPNRHAGRSLVMNSFEGAFVAPLPSEMGVRLPDIGGQGSERPAYL
jgi:hypothetical protein